MYLLKEAAFFGWPGQLSAGQGRPHFRRADEDPVPTDGTASAMASADRYLLRGRPRLDERG